MRKTTRPVESSAVRTVFVAFELSNATWRLAMTTSAGEPARHYTVPAGDVTVVMAKLERARRAWGLPSTGRAVSCYEAGRDGFWLHRFLIAQGVENQVIDPSSIERDRRAKVVKTDRVDADRLLELLVGWAEGHRRLRVVRVPSVEDEDARQPDRELGAAKAARTAITNRMRSLLVAQGVRLSTATLARTDFATLRLWDGTPLPPQLAARLTRERDALSAIDARIRALSQTRAGAIRAGATPATAQMQQLTRLKAVGPNGASRLVTEFFAWRTFANGREIGALAGLAPSPFASGRLSREQGISKAGNARVRTMAIELAWSWLRWQPASALSRWFTERFGAGSKRLRRVGIVALARKLLIALWRFLQTGALPEGALLSAA